MSHMYNSLGPKKHGKFWILWDTLQKAQLLALSLVRLVYSTVFSHPLTNQSTPLLPRPMGNQLLHNHLLLTSAPIIHLRPKWDPGKHRDGAVSRAMWYLFGTSGHRVGIHIHIYIHIYIYIYIYIYNHIYIYIYYIKILYQDLYQDLRIIDLQYSCWPMNMRKETGWPRLTLRQKKHGHENLFKRYR